MATQTINREDLKQKVMNRASEIIDKYSYSAERGIEELEKEMEALYERSSKRFG